MPSARTGFRYSWAVRRVTGWSNQPSSTSGTNRAQAWEKIRTSGSRRWIARAYVLLLTVVGVPMTPTCFVRVVRTVICAPASMTSRTGTGERETTASWATAAIVLQAMMSSLTSRCTRNSVIWAAYRLIVSADLTP